MKQDDNPNDEGKVKIKYTTPEDRPRLDDLVGVAKEFTLEFKKGLEFEQMYHLFGITPAKSYLLYGLPGTGKTMAIQALNNSLNHIAYKILQEQMRLAQQGKEYTLREQAIINKQFEDGFKLLLFEYDTGKYGTAYINRGARIIQTFFNAAIWMSYKKPVLISIDEADSILFSRKNGRQGHTEDIKNLETLMKNLQRVHDLPNIYVVMMSNYRDAIDDAVLRAGRVDEKILFELPNEAERRRAFKEFVKKANQKAEYRVIRNVDYNKLAKLSQGYNYADIKNVIDKTIRRKVNSLIDERVVRNKIIRIKYINGQQLIKSVIEYNDKFKEQNQKRIGFI